MKSPQEMEKKRKNPSTQNQQEGNPKRQQLHNVVIQQHDLTSTQTSLGFLNDNLELTLSPTLPSPPQSVFYQTPLVDLAPSNPTTTKQPAMASSSNVATSSGTAQPLRAPRRNTTRARSERSKAKSETVPVPFAWATDKRATVHSMEYLRGKGIHAISGDVQCKKCERTYTMEYNVQEKFQEVAMFLLQNQHDMHNRAPKQWKEPVLPTCKFCGQENICKPVLSNKKRSINWLFLLLGQLLGCCTLEQLKYFCKHTQNHRTGAKDRVLYSAYVALCKQLEPNGPFQY